MHTGKAFISLQRRPYYRGKGLSRDLINNVMKEYESQFSINVNVTEADRANLRKLDISKKDDLSIILRLAAERITVSRILGVQNNKHVLLFYCLLVFSDNTYYL